MTIIYKWKDSPDTIKELRGEHLSFSDKSLKDFKEKQKKEFQLWKNRYNELSKKEKKERWGKMCKHYANNALYAIKTAFIINSDEDYQKIVKQTYITKPKEITEKLYYDMLECLPPGYKKELKGFYVTERIFDNFVHNFYKENDKYYVRTVDLDDVTTWK